MTDTIPESPQLEFKPLSTDCPAGAFSCGEEEIDGWFRKKALAQHDKYSPRTTTAFMQGVEGPVAFYALTHIAEQESLLDGFERSKQHFPALHIEWLAVDKRFQRQGIGTVLMGRIIDVFIQTIEHSGLPALTLVALNEKVEAYYAELGFKRYGLKVLGGGRRMLLPRETALELRT